MQITITNSTNWTWKLICVAVLVSTLLSDAQTVTRPDQMQTIQENQARTAALAFEQQLTITKDNNARYNLIHTYNSGLRSPQEKQAAIALISSRYFSPIPLGMRAEVLIPLLTDDDRDIRRSTVQALGFVANVSRADAAKITKRFASMLTTDPYLRTDILMAIGLSHHKEYAKKVSHYLRDTSPAVRAEAAFCVATLTAPDTSYQLQIAPLLEDADRNVRQRAISALYVMNSKSVERYMEKMLTDPDARVRIDVIRLLVYSHAVQASPAIQLLSNDPDELVRKEVEDAIKQLNTNSKI